MSSKTQLGTHLSIGPLALNTTAGVSGCLIGRKCTNDTLLFRGGPGSSWWMLVDLELSFAQGPRGGVESCARTNQHILALGDGPQR